MAAKKTLDVEALRKPMEAVHAEGLNYSYEWRVKQLKALQSLLGDHAKEWTDACFQDLHKDPGETELAEICVVTNEIDYMLKNLKQLMKPKSVAGPALFAIGFSQIMRKPLSSPGVLIIGPFNYPIHLTLLPLVGSLAGGNPAVIKPSELCPTVSALMAKLVPQYFEPGAVQVVEGSVPEVTELLKHSWGKIVFTGSAQVGKIIAQAAAKTLTPTLLELGGKSPCFVDETAPSDMKGMATRIIWGKTFNAGQTCIAPDYLVCHEKHVDALCEELVKAVQVQFGTNPMESELSRIVTTEHAKRQVSMIQEVEASRQGKILCGGSTKCNIQQKFVCPTLILNPPHDCKLLQEEIFGPILPIIVVKSRQEAIQFIQKQYGTPLALYVFTRFQGVYEEIVQACPSGGASRNELLFYGVSLHLPFGGLGTSGYGTYHGHYSWNAFTHEFPSLYRPLFGGSDFGGVRFHPFSNFRRFALRTMAKIADVPVLNFKSTSIVMLSVLLATTVNHPWKNKMWQMLGDVLHAMADWAQSSSCVAS